MNKQLPFIIEKVGAPLGQLGSKPLLNTEKTAKVKYSCTLLAQSEGDSTHENNILPSLRNKLSIYLESLTIFFQTNK